MQDFAWDINKEKTKPKQLCTTLLTLATEEIIENYHQLSTSMEEKNAKCLIYGAYGYTGKLITDLCIKHRFDVVIAGRNSDKVNTLAKETGFASLVFGLEDSEALPKILEPFTVVLHCAGPFMFTAEPMMRACIESKTHYLDITGEIQVFERAASLDESFKKAGICAIPGVGFDVVPSDCMAAYVKKLLPDAQALELAIYTKGGVSRGTSLTMIENLEKGGAVRKNHTITKVPAAWRIKEFTFGDIKKPAVTIPWGDVSTAWHSTKIPNIEVYMSLPRKAIKMNRMMRYVGFLFKMGWLKNIVRRKASEVTGPDETARKTGETRILATATNSAGKKAAALLQGPEGYTLTALTAFEAMKRVLNNPPEAGFHTPSMAFGEDFILEFDDVKRTVVTEP